MKTNKKTLKKPKLPRRETEKRLTVKRGMLVEYHEVRIYNWKGDLITIQEEFLKKKK